MDTSPHPVLFQPAHSSDTALSRKQADRAFAALNGTGHQAVRDIFKTLTRFAFESTDAAITNKARKALVYVAKVVDALNRMKTSD